MAAGPPTAWAEETTHVFDPTLSLRGDCGTNSLDLQPDPGCPYPAPPEGPETFNPPIRVALDPEGDIYAIDGEDLFGPNQRIYIFDAAGHWIRTETKTHLLESLGEAYPELKDPERALIEDIEVDSAGNLYVVAFIDPQIASEGKAVIRYSPSSYPPDQETTYGSPNLVVAPQSATTMTVAVDSEDRLYVDIGSKIDVYSSAEGGNAPIVSGIGSGVLSNSRNAAVGPAPDFDIYAVGLKPGAKPIPTLEEPFVSEVYVFEGLGGSEPGHLVGTIDGSDAPNCATVEGETECGFSSGFARLDIAVDRTNSDAYVSDLGSKAVYQFRFDEESGEYDFISKVTHSFENDGLQAIALDSSASSPNIGYLYVTSRLSGVGHLYAFKPIHIGPPLVSGESVSGLSTTEALLEADVNPNGAATRYRFEYVDEATYLKDLEIEGPDHGFDHAVKAPASDAVLAAASEPIAVSLPVTGLSAGTTYRFRVVAENCDAAEPEREECDVEGEAARFATYPSFSSPTPCPNEALRTGRSAALPDCRAYELVTPPDTNGLTPGAFSIGGAGVPTAWSAPLASPNGESALFITIGGALPGYGGSGALNSDGYRSQRDPESGWHTEAAGPSGEETEGPAPGSFSPDHDYWTWTFLADTKLSLPDRDMVRMPDGSFQLLGKGSLLPEGDPAAQPRWISAGGDHIVFASKAKLEEDAPPVGTIAIYDRPASGPTRVVSLLPGDVVPGTGQDALYQGSSADGSTVAFAIDGTLYVRIDNAQTREVTDEEAIFAGLSQDGGKLFYLRPTEAASGLEPARGDLFAFDTATGTTTEIASGGKTIPVNVSADGTAAYFVSSEQLNEGSGEEGEDNLYVWDAQGESIDFIAVLQHVDVTGEDLGSGKTVGGLGLWTSHAVSPTQEQFKGRSSDPSRTTPQGDVFLFETRADLTGESSSGDREVYRYDSTQESLICISCDPTLVQSSADSKLVLLFEEEGLLNPLAEVANLSADGKRAFFESPTALVPSDVNDTRDVYEWRARDVDACTSPSGCLALISSGQSALPTYLYGASADGNDVFIWTNDILLPSDKSETASIYDARVDGGFPEAQSSACEGEACRPQAGTPPVLPGAGSEALHSSGNVHRVCPKGKRKVRRAGRTRCVKKQRRHGHRRKHHHRGVGR